MVYRNNMKNREFGKEGRQNLHSERAIIAERQGASENANFGKNPTLQEPDSSGCFCIKSSRLTTLTLMTVLGFAGTLCADGTLDPTLASMEGPSHLTFMEKPAHLTAESKPSIPNFPYADSKWFTQGSLLIWKPFVEDLDYGVKTITEVTTAPHISVRFKPEKQAFNWQPGVRVGFGTYLSNHDSWDISGTGTYFYGDSKNRSTPKFSDNSLVTSQWIPTGAGNPLDHATSAWALNFLTADISVGREYTMLPTLNVHPYIGARGAWIYQKNKANYSGVFTLPIISSTVALPHIISSKMSFKSHSDFWGIGPRIGTNFTFKFGDHFALLGNFAASLLMGKYENRSKIKELIVITSSSGNQSTANENFRLKDPGFTIRSNLEGSLGLGWEWNHQTKNNHDIRFAPSILFEASEWFNFNQFPRSELVNLSFPVHKDLSNLDEYNRLLGDLGFIGVTINLHVDF